MLDKNKINEIFNEFKIKATCVALKQHRHFQFADINVDPGGLKKLNNNLKELSLHFKCFSQPLLKLIPSKGIVQLQLTLSMPHKFLLSELLEKHKTNNSFVLGETIEGNLFDLKLNDDPHLLISGTTGSGKSNLLHNIIVNALRIKNVELHLIDPKKIEFNRYENDGQVHSLTSSYEDACNILKFLLQTMELRYSLLNKNKSLIFPKSIVIIDELADIILQDKNGEFETSLVKLAAKARACGIHLIVATQRPSVNVVTGLIKANFPARLACRVASGIDSRIILDELGAESLLGKGDALFKSGSVDLTRIQIALAE